MSETTAIPRARVELDGRPLADAEARTVTRLMIRQALNAPTQCELTLTDPPPDLLEDDRLEPAQPVNVQFTEERTPAFKGRLAAVEYGFEGDAGRVIRLRAYDRLHELRRTRHVRVLAEPTLHELAQTVASPAGLKVAGGEGVRLPGQLIQHRQSDLQFLVEWAGAYGCYLACDADQLRLVRLNAEGPPVTLERDGGLWQVRFERTVIGDCEASETVGWDAGTLERRTGRWDSRSSSHDRAPTLRQTNRVLRTTDDEEEHARAEMERRDSGRLVIWATGQGDARIQPGETVEMRGFGSSLEAAQTVTEAEHTLDEASGFVTRFTTDPPRLPNTREPTEITVGRVVDTQDPDGHSRVRVALEAFGEVETDWLPVMIAGAGPDKGLTIYPEADDLVLVLLCGADPSSGVVLGGLYGTEPSADADAAERRPRPYSLRTPGGQRLRLDDEGALARLENADGSYLEMTGEEVVLHASRNLRIEAPGRELILGAASIDMRSR